MVAVPTENGGLKINAIRATIVLWYCMLPSVASTQSKDPHEAQPERPTVATHAGTVACGWLEMEAGGERDYYRDQTGGFGLPITWKLGLSSRVQFSLVTPGIQSPGARAFQFGDLAFGVKWRLADDLPVLGRFALLPSIKLPTASAASGAGSGTTDVNMLLISSHDLGPIALDINGGITRRSGDGNGTPNNASLWTISLGGPATGILGWVAEIYGLPGTSGPAGKSPVVATLVGPTLIIEPYLVFDLGVIVPFSGPQPRAFYVGGVWNIGRVWE